MATPIENNTQGLQEILQLANSLPTTGSAQNYGKLVVFGDSICDGTGNANHRSFVDVLAESGAFESVVKAGMNSATIGPYQVNAIANGYDLCSQIETYRNDVADADIILCEYGANDIGAVMTGNVQMGTAADTAASTTVCGYMQTAIDRIRELNPDVTIHWVYCLPRNHDDIRLYFDANYADTAMLFTATALRKVGQHCCFIIHTPFHLPGLIVSEEDPHPNAEGHNLIANEVMHSLFQSADLICKERVITMGGDIITMSNLTLDIEFALALQLAQAGVNLKIQGSADGTTVIGFCSMHNEYFVMFNIIATDTAGQPILATASLAYNGTIYGAQYPLTGQAVSQYVKDYLYKAGTERVNLTYGTNASNSGSTINIVGSTSDLSCQVITKTQYNITANTKYLVVDIESISTSGTSVVLGIATTGNNIRYFSQLQKYESSYKTGTFKVDVSEITGQYYVVIAAYGGAGTCKITNWYFEETE